MVYIFIDERRTLSTSIRDYARFNCRSAHCAQCIYRTRTPKFFFHFDAPATSNNIYIRLVVRGRTHNIPLLYPIPTTTHWGRYRDMVWDARNRPTSEEYNIMQSHFGHRDVSQAVKSLFSFTFASSKPKLTKIVPRY